MGEFAADVFTDAENTLLLDHTPTDGRAWTWTREFQGGGADMRINSNRARLIGGGASARYLVSATPGDADQIVTANWTRLGTAVDVFLAFRLRASSSGASPVPDAYEFQWTGFVAGGVWRLAKIVSEVETELGTFDGDETDATTYSFKAEAIGSAIKLYTSDTERISVTDTAITQVGQVGLRKFDDGTGAGGWAIDDLVASSGDLPIRFDYSKFPKAMMRSR